MPGSSPLDPLVPSIAVIPFADRGNATDGVVVGELIADGVISLLSKSSQLKTLAKCQT
jgi:TolB-like protein